MVKTLKPFKLLFSSLLAAILAHAGPASAEYAFSLYDTPKYPAGFSHFDYVNPDAPKRGTLYLANPDRRTSFDKFNPFSLKGVAAAGIDQFMFETLAVGSSDEVASMYGLLADDMVLAPDSRSMRFHLNPKARFNNGDAVTAADVKYSFDTLIEKGAPQFKSLFGDVARCVVVDDSTVRFDFKSDNRELPLIVGGLPVFSRKWAAGTPFDRIQLTAPIASGPYAIESYDLGRSITYRRRADYWGNDVPARKGMYNFARIVYRFYKDDLARLEAFKAGEFDVVVEYSAKNWARGYTGPKFSNGEIVKKAFPHHNGANSQGFVMNLRRPQFQDVRVRQALGLALDFEWMNRQLFYNQYTRLDSYFANSELAATGAPSEAEQQLLQPFKGQLPAAVFGPVIKPPNTNPPGSLRANLLQARQLFAEAGWHYRDGALRNDRGDIFQLEILDDQPSMSRVIGIYVRNLEKLGVRVNQRVVDFALAQKLLENFEFDMTSLAIPASNSPGSEMFDIYGSRSANEPGSNNVWGLKNAAVDQLLAKIVAARSRAELVTATHALDRVLLNLYITVPHWYSGTHRMAYRNRFGIPATLPLYYEANPYVVSMWWEEKPR
ncbi:MAG: ABC transporter substrate-binding protein [Herbaspirillum sp.]|nr:ABC transporter substrate-binding protein [Herbaspirillum sp.]